MFVESLLESGNVHHKGRGWATTLSITLQALLLAALVALPIFRPDKILLESKSITSPVAFGRQDAPPDQQPQQQRSVAPRPTREAVLTEPREIPTTAPTDFTPANTNEAPPAPCVIHCGGVIGDKAGIIGGTRPPIGLVPTPPVRPPARPVVSQLELGGLIHQVQPSYPRPAVAMRLEGSVVMRALVDREGRIASIQVLTGHPLFNEAARSAVSQWRYRPYLLNGQPVEVETQITVNFKLNR